MAQRPAVSIIIPAYNGEDYLRPCLDSVFAQTLKGVQVICVNDGSTDGTGAILEEYRRAHPEMVVITQENGGLSAARNAGVAKAEGEYIDFLDCDDALTPDALEKLYARASSDCLDMLFYDGETIYATEELRGQFPGYEKLYRTKVRIREQALTGQELFVRLVEGGSYRASACMYLLRTDFLREQGFSFIPGVYYEDNVFTLKCLFKAQRAGIDPTPYYQRAMREGSIVTTHKNYRHARSYYICQNAIQSFLLEGKYAPDALRCAQRQISSLMGSAVRVYAELSEAEKKQALAQYPDAALIGAMVQGGVSFSALAQPEPQPAAHKPPVCLTREAVKRVCEQPFQADAPLVSVILPVYNAAEVLPETIADLQAQKLRNFEMIFVDDGSTDDSCAILERSAAEDARIRILKQQNRFAGVARNYGMAEARGQYLMFLDSDDRFAPNLLADAVVCAQAQNAEVVLFHADLLRMPQEEYAPAPYLCPCDRLPEQVFSAVEGKAHIFDVLNPWTKLYSHEYIKRLGIQYQPLFSSNDLYFSMIAMASAARIAPLPEVLVHYRVGQENNIQSKKSKAPLDVFHAFKGVREELEARGLFEEFRKPFAVKAAESMLRSLDTMKSMDGYRQLYNTLHDGGMALLELDVVTEDDMKHISNGAAKLKRCKEIMENDLDTCLLQLLTGTGSAGAAAMAGPSGLYMQEMNRLRSEVAELRASHAFRIGSKITRPLHAVKKLLGK